jgi:hypothetical protein
MEQVKNIQFTILIKAGGHLREFNFRKSSGIFGVVFMVDVAELSGIRHYLMFRQEDEQWVLQTVDMPGWLTEVLPRIHEAINQFS